MKTSSSKVIGIVLSGIGALGLVAVLAHAAYFGQKLNAKTMVANDCLSDAHTRDRALRWHWALTGFFAILLDIGGEIGR